MDTHRVGNFVRDVDPNFYVKDGVVTPIKDSDCDCEEVQMANALLKRDAIAGRLEELGLGGFLKKLVKWDEKKHPRDSDGKFQPKAEAAESKEKPVGGFEKAWGLDKIKDQLLGIDPEEEKKRLEAEKAEKRDLDCQQMAFDYLRATYNPPLGEVDSDGTSKYSDAKVKKIQDKFKKSKCGDDYLKRDVPKKDEVFEPRKPPPPPPVLMPSHPPASTDADPDRGSVLMNYQRTSDDRLNKVVENTMAAINYAHKVKNPNAEKVNIDMSSDSSEDLLGMYHGKISVFTGSDSSTPELTLAHEYGHYLESKGLTDEQRSRIPEVIGKMYQSETFKGLLAQSAANPSLPGETSFYQYAMNEHELWARGYSQWVAYRSTNANMVKQVNSQGYVSQGYWHQDEFGPIAEAISKVFE